MQDRIVVGKDAEGADVSLSADDAVTGTRAVLGIRNSGKTNTEVVITEQIIRAGYVEAIVDPLDVWWGLRSSADGTADGLPVYVFGGPHGDAPLEATAGAVMARWIIRTRESIILSLKHLPHAGQAVFMRDFARELYRGNSEPLHVVIDEVARFCPQQVRPEMAGCVGAVQDLGSEARASGIGTTVIGQRASRINKDVLTQAHTISTDEIGRVKPNPTGWITNRWPLIEANVRRSDCEALLRSLSLPIVKSACTFCPYRRAGGWRSLTPEERAYVIRFDARIRDHRPGFLCFVHDSRRPISEVFAALDAQPGLFTDTDQKCDSGVCFV